MNRELITLTQKLINIDSSNPPGKEKEVISFIQSYLAELGVPSKIYEFKKERPNLICAINSINRRKKIVLTPHIDTVPVTGCWRFGPFSGKVYKGRIYGRGATDDKGNAAVALYLIKILKQEKILLKNLDLVFAFTADEETGSDYGIKPLLKKLRGVDYGIVLDSGEFDIVVAQKGLLHIKIEIFGKEAHGAYPERGINAIEKSVYILKDILKEKLTPHAHPLLKETTVNIGTIQGGEKVNIVAGYNSFELDIRYIPPFKKEMIIKKIRKIIERYKVRYKIQILASQEPLQIRKTHFLIKELKRVLRHYRITPCCKPSFGATVINFLKDKGIDTFAFGFGSKGCAHTTNEYVKIDNLVKGVKILKTYLLQLDALFEKKKKIP